MPRTDSAPLKCPSCDLWLESLGTKKLHEGVRWGVLGRLGELLVTRLHFDMYYCPRCGRVAAFLEEIGGHLRRKEASVPDV